MTASKPPSNSGSHWHRWEPHIHTPGTILNDQFNRADAWERYLTTIEGAVPAIRALGITDYYSTDSYQRVRKAKEAGRLPNCAVIFPNIEMRLAVGTVKGQWVNVHLLVSPDDPKHLEEIQRFLARLRFSAFDDWFCCRPEDLIKLGYLADPNIKVDAVALAHGSTQFKVDFAQLKTEYRASAWAEANILVAVAGGNNDGTSGVRSAADKTLREEVESFAHIIFSSSPNQRDFWLGLGAMSADQIKARYGNLKPCLHGSDAHDHQSVGAPANDRFSWIKGAVSFDTLRQACLAPIDRAYVGDQPPPRATPSQVIRRVSLSGASWAKTPSVELNPGLVAIIGARGSGKTALADIIAAGCDAVRDTDNKQSFLYRAREFLDGASVTVEWEVGDDKATRPLDASDEVDFGDSPDVYPRAQYLSQKFVEDLCSSDGVTDELLREIERVIFESHDVPSREGALDFDELLDLRATRHRQARLREEQALSVLSDRIGTELEKTKLVPGLKTQVSEKTKLIARYTEDRARLMTKGSQERIARLHALTAAVTKVRGHYRWFKNQEQALLALNDEVTDLRQHRAPEALRQTKERHGAHYLNDEEWPNFLLKYTGNVDGVIQQRLGDARKNAAAWLGTALSQPPAPETPLIADDADLDNQTISVLEAEIRRVEALVGIDRQTADRFSAVSKRIEEETSALARLNERLADCETAKERVAELLKEREQTYVRAFEAILAEQDVLEELYAPLMNRLAGSGGSLGKLSFSIKRVADVEAWARAGEKLLDLRRQGPFKGEGTLQKRAEAALKPAWETGEAGAVSAAISHFRTDNQVGLLEHSPIPKSEVTSYRAWLKQFAEWLYSTKHISVHYSVDYDGIDIRKLSPGTRGIVLLLLYLALDDADDRPLIIDQPEENLDPKSIFDELVGLFIQAKRKRQVIIVTHNANLVVNTDADQIIVAHAGPHQAGNLPPITYEYGGLEEARVRKAVCDILEGGESAFQERARRLRIRLAR